jgi:cell division GTPase FtsZ
LRYLDESGGKALVDLAPRLIARRWWTGKTDAPKAMLVGATGPTDLTLSDLNEAFEEILNVVSDETTVMFYATIDEGLKVGTGGHLRLLGTLD